MTNVALHGHHVILMISNIFSPNRPRRHSSVSLLKARSLDRGLQVRGYVVVEEGENENGGGGKQFRKSVCSLLCSYFLELFV